MAIVIRGYWRFAVQHWSFGESELRRSRVNVGVGSYGSSIMVYIDSHIVFVDLYVKNASSYAAKAQTPSLSLRKFSVCISPHHHLISRVSFFGCFNCWDRSWGRVGSRCLEARMVRMLFVEIVIRLGLQLSWEFLQHRRKYSIDRLLFRGIPMPNRYEMGVESDRQSNSTKLVS